MLRRLSWWYSQRVVNVNVNIVAAGILALGPVLVVVNIAESLLSTGLKNHQTLQTHHQLIISGLTFLSDVIFDVAIYYCLHWLANHSPRILAARKEQIAAVADASKDQVPFFKDATKVQLQRAVLSPLLYFLWLGSQFAFMNSGQLSAVWATVFGFGISVGVVRTIHTFWMLGEQKGREAVLAGRICGKCGRDLERTPTEAGHGLCPGCGEPFVRKLKGAGPSTNGHAQSLSENGLKSVPRS